MASAGNEVTAEMSRHPRGWLIVRLALPLVGQIPWELNLMLNTGRPYSALSRTTYATLAALGQVTSATGSSCLIHSARLGTTTLSNIPMRLSAGPALIGLEGMLGLDFFEQFAEVRFQFPPLRPTLIRS
jgi:hypothetical protein